MKGGTICKVIAGKHIGQYIQAPHAEQTEQFSKMEKMFVYYFQDEQCTVPVYEGGSGWTFDSKQCRSLISIHNLEHIGYYD